MYNWITLQGTWNQHSIVNQLYTNKIKIWKKIPKSIFDDLA